MGKLSKVTELVESCLKEDVGARNSDWKLYEDVCKKLGFNVNAITLHQIVENTKQFPSYESVTRARRKLQENGEYTATNDVQMFRKQQELDFIKEFA